MSKITEEMERAGVAAALDAGNVISRTDAFAIYTAMHKARPVEDGMVEKVWPIVRQAILINAWSDENCRKWAREILQAIGDNDG